MIIDESLQSAPIIDKGGYHYLIHPLTDGVPRVTPELLQAWQEWATQLPVWDADLIVAPEAMAIPLATVLGQAKKLPFVVVRKRKYNLPGEEIAYCETGYGRSCLHINDVRPGERVIVVDDVLSTGGTLDGVLSALEKLQANIVGVLIFLDKGDARKTLESHHDVPFFVMRTVSVTDGRVHISEAKA